MTENPEIGVFVHIPNPAGFFVQPDRGRLREGAKSYALMTAIRDTARVYPFAGRKTSVRIDLGGCAADA
ncbi:hypothetical protein BRX36_20980 [Sphingomonas sp. S-NIH.Pt1_0416]|nr:hypothetical protein BRX36_20980 [Sphingomonas sp. S-NIH.Pt1_0416]